MINSNDIQLISYVSNIFDVTTKEVKLLISEPKKFIKKHKLEILPLDKVMEII